MSRNGEASIREGGGTKRRKQYQCHFGKHTSKNVPRKVVSKPRFASVDEATLTWLKQQRDAGVLVRGTEVLNAAKKLSVKIQEMWALEFPGTNYFFLGKMWCFFKWR